MSERNLFSDITANRHLGNERSRAANRSVAARKPSQRDRIVAFIRSRGTLGATCEEVAQGTGLRYTSASARISELKAMNWLRPNGQQRETTAKDTADVLVLTPLCPPDVE